MVNQNTLVDCMRLIVVPNHIHYAAQENETLMPIDNYRYWKLL